MSKAPDKLLTVPELVALTGFRSTTIHGWMKDPQMWAVPGGAKLIAGQYRLPVSFFNRWVEKQDLAVPASKQEAVHAG